MDWELENQEFFTHFLKKVRPEKRYTWIEIDQKGVPIVRYTKFDLKVDVHNPTTDTVIINNNERIYEGKESNWLSIQFRPHLNRLNRWILQGRLDKNTKVPNLIFLNVVGHDPIIYFTDVKGYLWQKDQEFLNRIWFHNAPTDRTYDLMGCSICGAATKLVCGGCETTSYCSTVCQRIDFDHGGHQCK